MFQFKNNSMNIFKNWMNKLFYPFYYVFGTIKYRFNLLIKKN